MKIYRNKLYSIQDAAKRGGVTEAQINEMITYHVIMAYYCFSNVRSLWGEDIPGLKKKWEEWKVKKEKMKKADVSALRMEKGE